MDKQKPKQKMRYSDSELSLIKSSFAENDDLVRALRKTFLQMPLDAVDTATLNGYKGKELKAVVRKTFLPTLDSNAPLHQLIDLWLTLKVDEKKTKEVFPLILAREKIIEYLEQQLNVLDGIATSQKLKLSDWVELEGKTPLECHVQLIARNTILSHVEMQLSQLLVLAGLKTESLDDTQKRLAKDSMK